MKKLTCINTSFYTKLWVCIYQHIVFFTLIIVSPSSFYIKKQRAGVYSPVRCLCVFIAGAAHQLVFLAVAFFTAFLHFVLFVHWVVLPFVLVQCVCVHVAALPDCVHGVAVHAVFWSACVQQVCVLLAWHALALALQAAALALWSTHVAAWAHFPAFTIFAF